MEPVSEDEESNDDQNEEDSVNITDTKFWKEVEKETKGIYSKLTNIFDR